MDTQQRYLTQNVVEDLGEKLVLIAGPRQVGKTTFARYIGQHFFEPFAYFNWDYQPDRKEIISSRFPADVQLIIFDELHKYRNWQSYIKGLFDKRKDNFRLLVTGSAKLDVYRRGGVSLTGRYHHYVLHPFSLAELLQIKNRHFPGGGLEFNPHSQAKEVLDALLEFGPFPEPYLKQNKRHWRRWQSDRVDRLVKEEIREMSAIADLSNLQVLVEILPSKVASSLSINNLREDLEVAHKTAVNYLELLERFYFHFRIYPFAGKVIRSLRKPAKLYLWDWSVLQGEESEGTRFENLVASNLLKFVDYLRNVEGYRVDLHYLRDLEGREVDFLVSVNKRPWFAVETKLGGTAVSRPLRYFRDKLSIPHSYQVVLEENVDVVQTGVRIISAEKFLTGLV